MKSKTILFLAVVLVMAIAYLTLRNTDLFKPKEEPAAAGGQKTLLDLPKGEKALGELAHVEIAAAGGGTIVLDRGADKDKWRLAGPLSAAADPLKVQDLCDSIKHLQYVQSLDASDSDASDQLTSLNKPLWTLDVADGAGAKRKLLIGKNPPLSPGRTYVRVEGDKHVYVVASDLASMLNKSAADLRDKNVLVVKPEDVQKVEIDGSERYAMTRVKAGGGEDTWSISQPGSLSQIRADGPKVRDLLRRFDPLTAIDFVADAPASLERYGLDKPRLIVSIWSGTAAPAVGSGGTGVPPVSPSTRQGPGEAEETHGRDAHATTETHGRPAHATTAPALKLVGVAIGTGTTEKVYAKLLDQPAVFQIEASLLGLLGPKIADLRDKQVLHFDEPQVKGIIIQSPQGRAILDRKDAAWNVAVSGDRNMGDIGDEDKSYQLLRGKANQAAVTAALDALKHLEAQSFEDQAAPERYGLDNPQARIMLLLDKDAQVALLVGKASASGEMTFVQVEHGAGVAVVKTADIKPLLEPPASYWDPTIWAKPAGATVSQLNLSRPDGQFELHNNGTQWSMVKPLAVPANKVNVDRLLDMLDNVTAGKIVSLGSAVPAKYAGAKDLITVTVTTGQIAPGVSGGERAGSVSDGASRPATVPTTQEAGAGDHGRDAHATHGQDGRATETGPSSQPSGTGVPPVSSSTHPAPLEGGQTHGQDAHATQTHVLKLAKVDGNAYVWLDGAAVAAVGEMAASTYDDFAADLRSLDVWTIDPADVQSIKITAAKTLEFVRQQQEWKYPADSFVKIDAEKVKGFLDGVKQVQAQKFMPTPTTQPADYSLETPEIVIELGVKGDPKRLTISKKGPDAGGRYASASGVQGVFVVSGELVSKMSRNLDDFKK